MLHKLHYSFIAVMLIALAQSGHAQQNGLLINRSLLINDQATLDAADFSLLRVMNQLASQFSDTNPADPIDGVTLFARMWDAQNPAGTTPSLGVPQCSGAVNNFPVVCRPVEGAQALNAARDIVQYKPIAIVNRFDLRDKINFRDCGEYRIVYAKTPSTRTNRNFIIFEAELPNPQPGVAAGCVPVQKIWSGLSVLSTPQQRASVLASFYFDGAPNSGISKVIDVRNFNQNTGQIRTNQFMTAPWVLKEYKAVVRNGKNLLEIVTDKSNPVGRLFNPDNSESRAQLFRTSFVSQLPSLVPNDLTTMSLGTSNVHNNGQSHSQGAPAAENDFLTTFRRGASTTFHNQINSKLSSLGRSDLSVDHVLRRATAMTCGGCHQPALFGLTTAGSIGNNLSWPNSAGFVHILETPVNGIFPLSPALTNVFLPSRKTDLERFLRSNETAGVKEPSQQNSSTPSSSGDRALTDLPSEPDLRKLRVKRAG